MKKIIVIAILLASPLIGWANTAQNDSATILSLEDALKIALSENVSVKIADKEIKRSEYARKGTYAALFPQLDASASYQRTIEKQVMYMDGDGFNIGSMLGEFLIPLYAMHPEIQFPGAGQQEEAKPDNSNEGISVGRWNTWTAGVTTSMPIINFQLWESIRMAGRDVELAVEKARSSRLEMVSAVKQAYYGVLMAKESRYVYSEAYKNALENYKITEMKFNAQKASELDLTRAKATLQNAVPNLFNSEASVDIALWQLKAVMGIELDSNIDVTGCLDDYAGTMFRDIHENDDATLDGNSTMRQLAIQAEELASAVRIQKFSTLPSLSLAFSYNINAMTNDFNFSQYKWSPYSFLGVSLQIPIFAGGRRASQIKQSKIQYDEILMQQKEAERQLQISIRQLLTTMETCMKNYQAADAACATAQKAYDIAAKSYEVGRSTLTDLNDARLSLTQSQLGTKQCILNFLNAKTSLEQILGADYSE